MAALGYLVLAASCLVVQAFPDKPVLNRNTIFLDEKLEGGIFEHVDAFSDATLLQTTTNPFRLPTTTKPEHYDVVWTISINETSRRLSGYVNIQLYATQGNVNEIVIHAHDLDITSVELNRNGTIVHQTWVLQPEYHFLIVRPIAGALEYNAATPVYYNLVIEFNAPLRTDMYGIYESWYRSPETPTIRWMASTQFQATSARFAFPCYDEPSFKAYFDIKIRRPIGYSSWSCTQQEDTRPYINGYEEDVYYTTPKMSTYLLAMIVAEYNSLNNSSPGNNVTYEVIARPAAIADGQGAYAYEVGQELLAEMSRYTEIDFYSVHPNIKMTQAAIPDFSAGAMENWGLLTYREAYLLYKEDNTNSYFKQLIAYILSHEIAHMWFGNYVTCDWWDVLWLNEGFARYYQYFLTNEVETEMRLDTRFITEQVHTSLLSDSSNNPHPLTNPGVGSPASVSAMFSTISYNKGAAIIRMTEHLMGYENHRQGLVRYLRDRAFDTALPIDLFENLEATAIETNAISNYGNFSIIDYYKTWTEQSGHPVLNVYVDHQTGRMTINQRRFNINTGYSTANTNWIIPITFATAENSDFENTKPTHIIREAVTTIERGSIGDSWVIFNKQQTGFYRVNYDDYTWDLNTMLLKGPNREIVHEYNRAQIVDDVFQFARSGLMDYNKALSILSFMEYETAYAPWLAFISGFNWLHSRFIGTETGDMLEETFLRWSDLAINTLTYNVQNETFMESYLRYQLAPVRCRLRDPDCLDAANEQFSAFLLGQSVHVDNRNWVYCNRLRMGNVADFNTLWNRFVNEDVYTEKILLLQVLGCTPHRESLYFLLDAIVTPDNFLIRPQDYTTAFNSAVTGNENNTQIVLEYITENFEAVRNAFNSITTPLSYITSRLRNMQQVEEFREWAHENQVNLSSSYQAVLGSAQAAADSITFAAGINSQIVEYHETGGQIASTSTTTTSTTTPPSTVTIPPIAAPVTPELPDLPDLPDSASSTFLSALVISLAIIVNLAF